MSLEVFRHATPTRRKQKRKKPSYLKLPPLADSYSTAATLDNLANRDEDGRETSTREGPISDPTDHAGRDQDSDTSDVSVTADDIALFDRCVIIIQPFCVIGIRCSSL